MAAFVISVTLTLGGTPTLDINTNIIFDMPTGPAMCGTSWIPHVSTIDMRTDCLNTYGKEHLIRHEWEHHNQWTALGPAFPLAYALTAGRAFEYYGDGGWTPPQTLEGSCPLVRVSEGVEFMPCWRL